MEYEPKFFPEGWKETPTKLSMNEINNAYKNGNVMQGKVTMCDSNYNLYLDLGDNLTGIVPRDEIEAINLSKEGLPRPDICTNKVNKFIQFKIKDISKKDTIILSRKAVEKEAINWIKNDIKEGTEVLRNCKKH